MRRNTQSPRLILGASSFGLMLLAGQAGLLFLGVASA